MSSNSAFAARFDALSWTLRHTLLSYGRSGRRDTLLGFRARCLLRCHKILESDRAELIITRSERLVLDADIYA